MVYLKSLDLLQQQNVKLNAFLNFFSIMGEKEFKEHHALNTPKSWISACSSEMIILFISEIIIIWVYHTFLKSSTL